MYGSRYIHVKSLNSGRLSITILKVLRTLRMEKGTELELKENAGFAFWVKLDNKGL